MAPVHEAAHDSDVARLRALLDADPEPIEAEDEDGDYYWRPLHCACFDGMEAWS